MAKQIKTVTLAQIDALKWACKMADDWRGNQDPESYDEFDGWIAEVKAAVRAVERDRKRLRALLAPAADAPTDDAEQEVLNVFASAVHCAAYDDCKHELCATESYERRVAQIINRLVETAADETREES